MSWCLITGGTRRIGRSMALKLASEGYDILLHYNTSEAAALETQKDIQFFGVRCELFQGDLLADDFLQRTAELLETYRPEILINNASAYYPKSWADTVVEDWDNLMTIHAKVPFFLIQAFAKAVEQGLVINLVDAQVERRPIEYAPYILSKELLKNLTTLAARTFDPIRVNGISPGAIMAPESKENLDYHHQKKPLEGGQQEVLRTLELFLKSPFITGQVISVDGGHYLN